MVFVHIPTATYTARMWGARIKAQTCQYCMAEFVYELRRMARVQTTSVGLVVSARKQQKANAKAQEKLKRALETQIDPVYCPQCHRLQQGMVWKLRWRRLGMIMAAAMLIFLPVGIVAAGISLAGKNLAEWFVVSYFAGLGVVGLAVVATIVHPFSKSGLERAQLKAGAEADGYTTLALPRIDQAGRFAIRPTRMLLPAVCLGCGGEFQRTFDLTLGSLTKWKLPVCRRCKWRWIGSCGMRAVLPPVILGVLGGCIGWEAGPRMDREGIAAVGAVLGAIAGIIFVYVFRFAWMYAGTGVRVTQFQAWSDDANVKFRNPQVAEVFLENCLKQHLPQQV